MSGTPGVSVRRAVCVSALTKPASRTIATTASSSARNESSARTASRNRFVASSYSSSTRTQLVRRFDSRNDFSSTGHARSSVSGCAPINVWYRYHFVAPVGGVDGAVAEAIVGVGPAFERGEDLVGMLGQGRQPGAHVLAPLGVVGRRREHRLRPAPLPVAAQRVELVD